MNKELLAKTYNNVEIYACVNDEHMLAHANVNKEHIVEAIPKIKILGPFFMHNINLGRIVGKDECVEINSDDCVALKKRKGREGLTPIVFNKQPQDTELITLGICLDDDGKYTVFTAFYGVKAPREPWDKHIESEEELKKSEHFWKTHALCFHEGMLEA